MDSARIDQKLRCPNSDVHHGTGVVGPSIDQEFINSLCIHILHLFFVFQPIPKPREGLACESLPSVNSPNRTLMSASEVAALTPWTLQESLAAHANLAASTDSSKIQQIFLSRVRYRTVALVWNSSGMAGKAAAIISGFFTIRTMS
mmetsp:Transcript_19452/g.39143  ORF Transcript_19452/g.39143 Transcript_19452/m.39143 type:complete len:146 (-) Transcript_19452:22-459(-)